RSLKFSNVEVRWIAALADLWRQHAGALETVARDGDASSIRRLAAAAERTRLAPLLRLAAALWAERRAAGRAAPTPAQVRSLYRCAVRSAYRDAISLGDLAVDGDDLRRAGIPAGPMLGTILH